MLPNLNTVDNLDRNGEEVESTLYDEEGDEFDEDDIEDEEFDEDDDFEDDEDDDFESEDEEEEQARPTKKGKRE
jgi:hypothetical protein